MPLQLITGPTAEPIHLTEAKNHLRVTDTSTDSAIARSVAAARQFAETNTQRQIIAARWKLVLDSFPGPSLMGVPIGKSFSLPGHAILLPNPPLIQVVSIQYLDTAGVLQTMPAADYTVDASTEPARITPVFGKIWPINLPQIGSVSVTFDAGYAVLFTADATADTIAVIGWKTLAINDVVRLSNSGGALPAPLLPNTDYYIQTVVSPGVYKLSATQGGGAINLADAGTGSNFLGVVPDGLISWMLIRLGSLYENHEEMARSLQPLPFVDRLLDPYRMTVF
jgi:uncharacterized phiE125 gp8 family phage protein